MTDLPAPVSLFRLKWSSLVRRTGSFLSEFTAQSVIYALLVLIFWILCFFVVRHTILYVRNTLDLVGPFFLDRLLLIFLLSIFIMLIYANMLSAFSVLFASEDLPLLLSSPIRGADIYRFKLWESLSFGSWTYLIFGLPIFVAYGHTLGAPPGYYAAMVLGMIPYALLAGLCGVVLGTLLGSFGRHRRLRLAALLFWVLAFLLVLSLKDVLVTGARHQEEAATQLVRWEQSNSIYMPHLWLFRMLSEAVSGNLREVVMYLLLLWTGAAAMFGLVAELGGWLYLPTWQRSQQAGEDSLLVHDSYFVRLIILPLRLVGSGARSVIHKDVRLFFRDITQWGQMLVVVGLLLIYLIQLAHYDLGEKPAAVRNFVMILNLAVLGFVICALSVRFVFPSLSLEGRAIWTLASSTLTLRRLFAIKWSFHVVWLSALSMMLLCFVWWFLDLDLLVMLPLAIYLILLCAGSVSISVGIAALYPRFYARNAAEINSGTGAMVCIILTLSYLSAATFFLVAPVLWFVGSENPFREALSAPVASGGLWGLGLLLHLAVVALPFIVGRNRLEQTPL